MHRRDRREFHDGDLSRAMGGRSVRRGRRFTPPGQAFPRPRHRRPRQLPSAAAVQIGDVVAELTPRQAVVWLTNLDNMISLYESTTEQKLDAPAREQLVTALRRIVRDHGYRP